MYSLQGQRAVQLSDRVLAEEDSQSRGSEDCCSTCSLQQDETYVEVGHEDVVDAVADFVKERIQCNMLCSQYQPKDLAAAVDMAFVDEKQGRWKRLWGRGRLLMRSAELVGEIAEEFGPRGRTGQALRGAATGALTAVTSVAERVK